MPRGVRTAKICCFSRTGRPLTVTDRPQAADPGGGADAAALLRSSEAWLGSVRDRPGGLSMAVKGKNARQENLSTESYWACTRTDRAHCALSSRLLTSSARNSSRVGCISPRALEVRDIKVCSPG